MMYEPSQIKKKNQPIRFKQLLSTRVNPASSTLAFSTTTSPLLLPHFAVLFESPSPTFLFPILPPLPPSFSLAIIVFAVAKKPNNTDELSATDFSMASAISERVELAKLCSSRDWSKAIRVLDSLLVQSCAIQDICNRAFCYSQLELHKHVIKDCDRALQLDPTLLQAYILKGRAFSSLGRKDDALLVWEQGYEHALHQSADLKQLLELEELLKFAKQDRSAGCEIHVVESRLSMYASESRPHSKSDETSKHQNKLSDISNLCSGSRNVLGIHSKSGDNFEIHKGISDEVGRSLKLVPESGCHTNEKSSETSKNPSKASDKSELCSELRDAPEICCKSGNNFDTDNGLSDKAEGNQKPAILVNDNHDILDLPNHVSESCSGVSNASELSSRLSMIPGNLGDTSEILSKSSNKVNMHNEVTDETKGNKKLCVTRISKTKSISVDFRLSRGIAQVNEGKYATAISIFDQILKEDPTYPEALIGRGTARAFKRELGSAIADFSKAIESNPSAGEAWKRRGQARAALGQSADAINDLTKALEFEPNSADILHERGIVSYKFKDFDAAVEDLSACVKLDMENMSAYTYLGLALSSIGEYKKAEEAHLKAIQLDRNFLEAWAHLIQFYQDLANSTKALDCINQVLQIDSRFAKAYHLRGLLLYGMGEHRKAIKDLSIGLSIENANIESLYLRASCYHAIGEYGEAVKDYDATLDLELDSMEKFVLQCLAFYQKEIALYTASKINSEFCWFDIDGDIDPLFKEYWCKRLHPKNVCEKVYRQPPLRDSLKRGKLRKQDLATTKQKIALFAAADSIGQKIQYDCYGFLSNRRQHRMAGLAIIEIAQKVAKAWRSLQNEWKHSNKSTSKYGKRVRRRINIPSQNRGGAGCSTSSSSETTTSYSVLEDRSSGRSTMSWKDVYSMAVKWRQISEPCDPVVWVNKLSEEFNSGFGSHTPMILGQAKVVRYFQNYERTFDVAKTIMKDKLFVHSKSDNIIDLPEDKIQAIIDAKNCSDLYNVVGEDFWLATWCSSTAFEEKQLEGTRITLVKMVEGGFDFAIRTPCMPSRWDDFDAEMTMAWEAVCNAYCGETYGSTDFDVLENVRDAILRMTYYWYNFMPLSRGSAVVGFTVLLGLLHAANMEFTGKIPKGLQVDWEAILNFDPNSFAESVKRWLYPSLKITTSLKDYPDVASTLATTGSVVAALSSSDD
ncbi:suppressor of RPS4-RLD 1 isoform X1 [Populus alba x Populus x berolinensis]|uniref:Suppressor of RPS4-RLD 1 isoform X1 n=1 Tax=Populus alba x Populus x berolinensis TaxID=444605 RepID=A0AAD6QH90_9ROSI|nr:suppressor of RPS4-RLD 1 isoform X1 [Populus alba x Populus x berolinensis]